MPITLIKQKPNFTKKVEGEDKLAISELFCDTLQGEGVNAGIVSTFIRLQGCTLKCIWCDTLDVWPQGNEYSFDEIFQMFEDHNLIEKFKNGQHLILTGGSPLKQQESLVNFLNCFFDKNSFFPYIEIENECTILPKSDIVNVIRCWNNSPKLANSGMKKQVRYKPEIIKFLSKQTNSWFKFVVSNEDDWKEIKEDYLDTNLIKREQIILMPEGQTQEELNQKREFVADIAIREGVRFSDRMHVTLWNKKTGV